MHVRFALRHLASLGAYRSEMAAFPLIMIAEQARELTIAERAGPV